MSVSNSAHKFIARNRAPRVKIEHDVEVYGSKKEKMPICSFGWDLLGAPAFRQLADELVVEKQSEPLVWEALVSLG